MSIKYVPYQGNPDIMSIPADSNVATPFALVHYRDQLRQAIAERNELDKRLSGHGGRAVGTVPAGWDQVEA